MGAARGTARPVSRRALLGAGLGGAVIVGVGGAGVASGVLPGRGFVRRLIDDPNPEALIPDAPEGQVRLERVRSAARGRDVDLFTAVPHGHGSGAGLPVCLVLHGASATAADFRPFGLPRFLSAAVRAGVPPFVLAGADGGRLRWEPDPAGGDDPQRMLLEEMPRWLAERGFDEQRPAAWGWSMGGYGALRLAEVSDRPLRGVAAFSPAVARGDPVFTDVNALAGTSVGLWCGLDDGFLPDVRALAEALPEPPEVLSFGEGAHTRVYWNGVTPPAFRFIGAALAGADG